MKKWISLLLVLVIALGMMGCGKSENAKKAEELINAIGAVTIDSTQSIVEAETYYESLSEKEKKEVENVALLERARESYDDLVLTELTEDSWINVNNGDVYSLQKDGTGTHNETAITYTLLDDTLAIVEGLSTVQAKEFQWDRNGAIPRLIPDGENQFYVRERDYDEISKQITEENISILLSQEFWKASSATAFLSFLEGGFGWVVMTGQTLSMTWEMVDNNTVKCHLDYNGGKNMTLDIINDNGNYRLTTGNGTVYTPYSN